jgi:hypothetical protein
MAMPGDCRDRPDAPSESAMERIPEIIAKLLLL